VIVKTEELTWALPASREYRTPLTLRDGRVMIAALTAPVSQPSHQQLLGSYPDMRLPGPGSTPRSACSARSICEVSRVARLHLAFSGGTLTSVTIAVGGVTRSKKQEEP